MGCFLVYKVFSSQDFVWPSGLFYECRSSPCLTDQRIVSCLSDHVAPCSHLLCGQEADRGEHYCVACFVLFPQSRTPALGTGLSNSVHSSGNTQRCVSKVILNPVSLTVKINHYTISPPWIPTPHLCLFETESLVAFRWPQAPCVFEDDLGFTSPPASAPQVLGLQERAIMPKLRICSTPLKFAPLVLLPSAEKSFSGKLPKLLLIVHDPIPGSGTNVLSPVNYFPCAPF